MPGVPGAPQSIWAPAVQGVGLVLLRVLLTLPPRLADGDAETRKGKGQGELLQGPVSPRVSRLSGCAPGVEAGVVDAQSC